MPWATPPKAWNVERFAEDIFKLRSVSNLNNEGVLAVFTFIEGDSFWSRNALSPGGLLKRSLSTGVRKIDTIIGQMKPASFRQREKMAKWADDEDYECPIIF